MTIYVLGCFLSLGLLGVRLWVRDKNGFESVSPDFDQWIGTAAIMLGSWVSVVALLVVIIREIMV